LSRHSSAGRASGWRALVPPVQRAAVLEPGCCAAPREAQQFVVQKTVLLVEPVLVAARSGMALLWV
jgi:hypothetical protein